VSSTKGWQLEEMQKHVGGYIERVRVRFEGRVRDAYVNEDGMAEELPVNREGTAMLTEQYRGNVLLGNVAIWVPEAHDSEAS
jgi:hypothetical protein